MDQKNFKEFTRGHWEDASYKVSTKLAKWLGRRSRLKKKLTHGRTDARRTIRHDISSTGFQPVELKIEPVVSREVFRS